MATLRPEDTPVNSHSADFDMFGSPEWEEPICPRCEADIIRLLREAGGTDLRLLRGLEMNFVRREWYSLLDRELWVQHQDELTELNSGEYVLHDDDKGRHKMIDGMAKSIERQQG